MRCCFTLLLIIIITLVWLLYCFFIDEKHWDYRAVTRPTQWRLAVGVNCYLVAVSKVTRPTQWRLAGKNAKRGDRLLLMAVSPLLMMEKRDMYQKDYGLRIEISLIGNYLKSGKVSSCFLLHFTYSLYINVATIRMKGAFRHSWCGLLPSSHGKSLCRESCRQYHALCT